MLNALKKLFFWNYARNTWQWDVLCVVILIFIFLTPKSWFQTGERSVAKAHQNPAASMVFVDAQLVENAKDNSEIERRVRELTGRRDITVAGVKKVTDEHGQTRGYEVDIR